MNINIKKLHPDAKLPEYQTIDSAGADLFAYLQKSITIGHGEVAMISTGLSVALPIGFEMQIRARSGLASKRIIVPNSPGTIDSDYRGEIKILLFNLSGTDFEVTPFMRIAQGVIASTTKATFTIVDQLSETKRGECGFGSTGL